MRVRRFIVCSLFACVAGAALATPRCEGRLLQRQIDLRQEDTLVLLRARDFPALQARMDRLLDAYTAGTFTDEELFFEFGAFDRWSPQLTPIFQEWVARFPRSYAAHHAMALHTSAVAWQARGGRLASETSRQQFTEFDVGLRSARDWVLRSMALHPKPILAYQLMMTNAKALRLDVALPGAEVPAPPNVRPTPRNPRPDVLPLLRQSQRVQADNSVVRVAYATVLAPRWGGSLEALEALAGPESVAGLPADRAAAVRYAVLTEIASDHRFNRRLDEAARGYEAAARECRVNQPLIAVADIRLEQGRFSDALAAADAALAVVPGGNAATRSRALALRALGRHEEAVPLLQRLLPEGLPDVAWLLGEYHENGTGGLKRDLAEAKRHYAIAARLGDTRAAQRLQVLEGGR